jgi:hypothetical protein
MMMFRMSNILFSTACTPMWFLFARDLHPYLQRQPRRMFVLSVQEQQQTPFFLHELITFMSRPAVERFD